jgi:L-threonylcarbamoyladenylate synthase
MTMTVDKAAEVLLGGGVIAYPTEGVFGLGCLPRDTDAVRRLIDIKKRDPSKGLILIAANASQFDDWIDLPDAVLMPKPDPTQPITWVVPASSRVPPVVRGDNAGLAVRITTNPVAGNICRSVGSPVVSTSANLSGQAVAPDEETLRRQFGDLVDYIVSGACGPASGPSEIRELLSGKILRS